MGVTYVGKYTPSIEIGKYTPKMLCNWLDPCAESFARVGYEASMRGCAHSRRWARHCDLPIWGALIYGRIMKMIVALIFIVMTSFGGAATVVAACCPHMQAVSVEPDHGGHGQTSDAICASHYTCYAVAVSQTQTAVEQMPMVLSYVPVSKILPSATIQPPFRPPIANLSV